MDIYITLTSPKLTKPDTQYIGHLMYKIFQILQFVNTKSWHLRKPV